jgi:undecaprenyl-phosphate galactose phosphotransferase
MTAAAVLVLGDAAAVAVSYLLGYYTRNLIFSALLHVVPPALPFELLQDKLYVLAAYPFVFAYEGLYTKRLVGWEETRRYLRGVFIATALVVIILFLWRIWVISRLAVGLALGYCIVLAPLTRALLKRLLVRTGLGVKPVVVLGAGGAAELFSRELAKHAVLGYDVVQRVDRRPSDASMDEVLARVTRTDVSLVVVSDAFSGLELQQLFRLAERRFAELMVVPNEALLQTSNTDVEQVGNVLVMKYRYNLLKPVNRYVKRGTELGLVALLAVLLAPLLGLLSLLVAVSSRGPVLFRQRRVGRCGREFSCLKLRTMFVDAESRLADLLKADARVRSEYEQFARIANDPRVTNVGRFLRRYSLDELPQLLNVLRGEMALVGPRPYLPAETTRIGEHLSTIVRVRPGMTGLWQVSGRASLPFRERCVLDDYYIRNWSLWMDFSIMLRTVRAVFGARGAY